MTPCPTCPFCARRCTNRSLSRRELRLVGASPRSLLCPPDHVHFPHVRVAGHYFNQPPLRPTSFLSSSTNHRYHFPPATNPASLVSQPHLTASWLRYGSAKLVHSAATARVFLFDFACLVSLAYLAGKLVSRLQFRLLAWFWFILRLVRYACQGRYSCVANRLHCRDCGEGPPPL